MISVAIATFNGEQYIIEQLESIKNQSVAVDEVIISDDCSSDKTVEIVNNYIKSNQLKNWHIHPGSKNIGFSNNFFRAVKVTRGDIIFLADQDDIWEKNKIEVMSTVMAQDKTITMLASKFLFVDKSGNVIKSGEKAVIKTTDETLSKLPFSFFIGSSVIPGCSTCIRGSVRDFLKTHVEFDLNRSLGHDWYFSIVSSAMGDCYLVNENLIRRRIHDSNASKEQKRKATVLAYSRGDRIESFYQIINAHLFINENEYLKNRITVSERKKVGRMISFFKQRLSLMKSRNIIIWLVLGLKFPLYYQCAKNLKGALQLYVADLFYTYNINWSLHK